jgi:hypothetical protein
LDRNDDFQYQDREEEVFIVMCIRGIRKLVSIVNLWPGNLTREFGMIAQLFALFGQKIYDDGP